MPNLDFLRTHHAPVWFRLVRVRMDEQQAEAQPKPSQSVDEPFCSVLGCTETKHGLTAASSSRLCAPTYLTFKPWQKGCGPGLTALLSLVVKGNEFCPNFSPGLNTHSCPNAPLSFRRHNRDLVRTFVQYIAVLVGCFMHL